MYEKLIYLFLKLRIILLANIILKKYKVGNNSFFIGEKKKIYSKILIYLDNNYLAHMGDQIFFEPLMQILKKHNVNFYICVTSGAKRYFSALNYKVVDKPIWEEYDLIVSRSDFYYELKEYESLLLVKTVSLDDKICNVISREVIKFLNIEENYRKYKISKYENKDARVSNLIKKLIEDSETKYIIYSNYIDSGSMFSNKKNFIKLEEFCKEYSRQKNIK